MKPGFKLLSVLMLALLLVASATAQINWLKQDGSVKYLAWDDGSKNKYIYNGNSATFTTGYFGSTISSTVHVTATINSKADGKVVSTLVSKDVNVNPLGYEVITITPSHYNNKVGEYIIVIKLKDANTELVDTSLYLKVRPSFFTEIVPIPVPINPNDAPEMNDLDNKEKKENQQVQFTVSGTDADDDNLTFEAEVCASPFGSLCLGGWDSVDSDFDSNPATFNKNTGSFKWKPSYDFVEHFSFLPSLLSKKIDFRFRAVDQHKEESAWERMTLTVKDVNRNPKFNPLGNQIIQEENVLQFTVSAYDADGDELEYSLLTPLPGSESLDKDTGVFKWIPQQSGLYFVAFKVEDGFGGKDTESILIQVTDAPVDEPQCDDGLDNDSDGVVDENDPGCHTDNDLDNPYNPADNDETNPVYVPQCSDGIDNDGDGKVDYGNDLDINDPGCTSSEDDDETDEPVELPQCSDEIDNDLDTYTDYPNDAGCSNPEDDDESDDPPAEEPQCSDGVDNDLDTYTDYPNDIGCSNQDDDDESNILPPEDNPQPAIFTNIKFKSAAVEEFFVHAGDVMAVHVSIVNNGKTDLQDVEVQVVVYEIGAFGSTSDFTLSKGEGANKNIYVPVPEEAQSGWYLIKITAKNFHYHTSTYRLVYITNNTF